MDGWISRWAGGVCRWVGRWVGSRAGRWVSRSVNERNRASSFGRTNAYRASSVGRTNAIMFPCSSFPCTLLRLLFSLNCPCSKSVPEKLGVCTRFRVFFFFLASGSRSDGGSRLGLEAMADPGNSE